MKLKYVEIENILSIQEIRLVFGETGLVLLDGWNHDDETANAAGKTAILNSIAYGIYGKFPRKISAADILRNGTKSGHVKVGIEVANVLYEVMRSRPNSLRFWIDGLEKDITQVEFESYIRLNYDQYLISQYSAQTEGLKLISLNDSGKKDFFLQLMNLENFDISKKKVDTILNSLISNKSSIVSDLSGLRSRIDAYTESLVDVSDIELKFEELNTDPIVEKIKSINQDKPDTSSIDSLESKFNNKLIELGRDQYKKTVKEKELSNIKRKIEKLSQPINISNEIDCPHCTKSFILSSSGSCTIDSLKKERKDELKLAVDEYNAILEEMPEDNFDEEEKIKEVISKCKSKREKVLEDFTSNLKLISELRSKKSICESQMLALTEALEKNTLLKNKIIKNNDSVIELESNISKIDLEIELYKTVSGLFSPTGAPAYVLDSTIDIFNEKIAIYTSHIWHNASYALQSFKENKSGDIKAKFSEKLTINGKDRSIGALSGGEHRCLSIAVDFAIVDVMETMFGIIINPIMLDEPFVGLDNANRERVFELLEKIACNKQIIVIDHSSESKAAFSTTILVEKRNGISNITSHPK